MLNILVTEAGGFIGKVAVSALLAQGWHVKAMMRTPRPSAGDVVIADMRDERSLRAALQLPMELDHNASTILAQYQRRRARSHQDGIYLGRPLRAVLTQPLDGRRSHAYHDMDFWSNKGGSVYRPALTLHELKRSEQFTYERPYLVESFSESGSRTVTVRARSLSTQRYEQFVARRVILAAGSLGTTRIVLRSLRQYDIRVPLTCNAHAYVPCLHPRGLGASPSEPRVEP